MNSCDDFDGFKKQVRTGVDQFLGDYFQAQPDGQVCRVAQYISLGSGHRWRAMVLVAAGQIFKGGSFRMCLPGACGIELAHSASLLLDDLPSMDNAQLRRGKPCAHLVFPRWAIDLAPVFLTTSAYLLTLRDPLVPADRRVAAAIEISRTAIQMVNGQEQDVTQNFADDDDEWLLRCYRQKSASLCAAAAKVGAILAGADDIDVKNLYQFGCALGMAYQFLDDIADAEGAAKILGKNTGMDAAKHTAISRWGVEETRHRAHLAADQALKNLETYGKEANILRIIVGRAIWAAA